MRRVPVLLCCWPGLPRLWLRGDWSALALALVFGAWLNGLIAAGLPGMNWLPDTARVGGWFALGGVWLFCALRDYRRGPGLVAQVTSASGNVDDRGSDDRGLFIQAQGEYLRGNWFEAESLLKEALRHSHRDVDARFLLATLYRRTQRFDEALAQLADLAQADRAEKWRWEIGAERRVLRKLIHDAGTRLVNSRDEGVTGREAPR